MGQGVEPQRYWSVMPEKDYEPRVGVYRQQAFDHLLGSKTDFGGPIPRVIPYVWPVVGGLTLAVALFLGGTVLIRVEDHATGTEVLRQAGRTASFTGQELVVRVKASERDAIRPGQLARIRFGDAGDPEAAGVVLEASTLSERSGEGGLVFPVKVRCTGEPNRPIPARDVLVTATITTRRRSALAVFLGWAK